MMLAVPATVAYADVRLTKTAAHEKSRVVIRQWCAGTGCVDYGVAAARECKRNTSREVRCRVWSRAVEGGERCYGLTIVERVRSGRLDWTLAAPLCEGRSEEGGGPLAARR